METIKQLNDAQTIAEHVYRMLLSAAQYPDFGTGGVPVKVAAEVFGKDASWVQAGIVCGWLPIGKATKDKRQITTMEEWNEDGKANFYISPKLLWEETGFVWKGKAGNG